MKKTLHITVFDPPVEFKADGVEAVYKLLLKSPAGGDDMRAQHEYMTVLFLDNKNRLLKRQDWGPGGLNQNTIYPGVIARIALLIGAVNIILAHNHPSGILEASADDIDMTKKVKEGLNILGIIVLDHIIYTNKYYFSFLQEKIL